MSKNNRLTFSNPDPRISAKICGPTIVILLLTFFACDLHAHKNISAGSTSKQTHTIERTVRIHAPARGDSRYKYVPFDVPADTVRIEISYQYDRAANANTLDIGLFDAHGSGSDVDPRGFRGWSGGRRSEFFVSRDSATPGYLPGAMPPGTWRIILGLYRVVPAGVDVSFKITITTGSAPKLGAQASPPAALSTRAMIRTGQAGTPALPASTIWRESGRATRRWWSGDLHIHTVHSDGDWTIDELVASARMRGLDFVSITDHNTSSHHQEIDRLGQNNSQPLVMRGEEITTYGGHTNAWGLPSNTWIDFRVLPHDSAGISRIAASVHKAGGIISINHPFAPCGGCAWTYDSAVRDFDAVEVWNGEWDFTDEIALGMWDKILQSGRHVTAIASSDSHRSANPIGQPTLHVSSNIRTEGALLAAIKRGRVYLTDQIDKPVLEFTAEMSRSRKRWMLGDEILITRPTMIRFLITTSSLPVGATISLKSNGKRVREVSATDDALPLGIDVECGTSAYFRIEVRDASRKVVALTNPIYVKLR